MIKKGFTLIELLVVIAVLGVLAAVVIVAINPLQQLAKGRDTGRISTVEQLGQAMVTYATSNNNVFPAQSVTWIATGLVTPGEVSAVPGAVGVTTCNAAATAGQNGFCYLNTTNATTKTGPIIVFTRLEALANNTKCAVGGAANNFAWALYSSADGRGGIVCTAAAATDPVPPEVGATMGICATSPCTTANQFVQ